MSGMTAKVIGPPAHGRLRGWAASLFERAAAENLSNIERLLRAHAPGGAFVDLGCDDGALTLELASAARADEIHGVEVVPERAEDAGRRGIEVSVADVTELPYEDASFDCVVSNQVIEHLADTDAFVGEIRRILRPGGVAVVSTENLASWHNIAALVLGWQPFSLTNVSSSSLGLGNPLAVHRHRPAPVRAWSHVRVFAYRGLRELFESGGLHVAEVAGAGYYPLPARFGRRDARHAAFLTVAARKP
jgi:SAM-dependent methyltransferase